MCIADHNKYHATLKILTSKKMLRPACYKPPFDSWPRWFASACSVVFSWLQKLHMWRVVKCKVEILAETSQGLWNWNDAVFAVEFYYSSLLVSPVSQLIIATVWTAFGFGRCVTSSLDSLVDVEGYRHFSEEMLWLVACCDAWFRPHSPFVVWSFLSQHVDLSFCMACQQSLWPLWLCLQRVKSLDAWNSILWFQPPPN